jgi:AhpC/TSA family
LAQRPLRGRELGDRSHAEHGDGRNERGVDLLRRNNKTGIMRPIRRFAAINFHFAAILCTAAILFAGGCRPHDSTSNSSSTNTRDDSAAGQASVREVDGRLVDQFGDMQAKAVVLIFTRTDCPIANRYAPEIRRLFEKFSPRGVLFQLVYPEASDSSDAIREHLAAFQYRCEAWRDPAHLLVRRFGAKVTPEVVVFVPERKLMIYRGRIDDVYVDFGRARTGPTTHELEDALTAALSGRPMTATTTTAVGCSIGDLP